jgi:trehalose 6-phosphate phosphatase
VLPDIDARLRATGRILIATDFDGTLCPIAETPSAVHLAPATLEVLRRASACSRITLAVISGRALADVKRRIPLDIAFAGNHGLEISGPGIQFEHAAARRLRPAIAAACESLQGILRQWPGACIEDKGWSATLHFRKVDRSLHRSLLFAARRLLASYGSQLALRAGNRALEVRPKVAWDKGHALEFIQAKQGPFDACICIGDDQTDETMFRANRNHVNIRIGRGRPTAATHYLSDSSEVPILLSHIVDLCDRAPYSGWIRSQEPLWHAGSTSAAVKCRQ